MDNRESVNGRVPFLFKLRHNISLEGDLALARMELEAFLPGRVQELPKIAAVADEFPALARLSGLSALDSYARPEGTQAMLAGGPLSLLPNLIRRPCFVQRIYCLARDTEETRAWLDWVKGQVGPVIGFQADGGMLVIQAIPHYALFELSEVVARRSRDAADTRRNLDAALDVLFNSAPRRPGGRGEKLARSFLSARSTISPLSHDLHYYKAKFFPRLARAMLNICAQRLGEGPHRLLEPFAGSGTALLEATTLGIPSVGLDIDPLSVLICQAKLGVAQLDSGFLAQEAARVIVSLESQTTGDQRAITFPAWLLKNRKMTAEMARQLSWEINVIRAAVAGCAPPLRPLFRVLMSDAIARRIRMRFLGTGVGRFSLTFAKTPAPRIFARSLGRYVKVAATCEWLRQTLPLPLAAAQVVEADARCLPDGLGTFDMVITSPPYLPASSGRESYAKARAPSLIALGIKKAREVDSLVDNSIGSMEGGRVNLDDLTVDERRLVEWLRGDPLRAIKAEPAGRYFVEMRQTFVELNRVMRPGALAVVVSGKQSTFYKFATRQVLYIVPSAELLAQEAARAGFAVEELHHLQLQKANVNARPRSLDDYYETLIFLCKKSGGKLR